MIWGFVGRDSLSATSTGALNWVMEYTGWLFMVLASLFVVFVLWLALGKFGNIPLGKDGEKPEFRTVSWVAMMFAAGMGIGLMFYGVAEPLYHYISPPPGTVDGRTPAAIQTAMATSIFHWTLHPWAMYAVVGIAMAYGTYRLGRRQLISACLHAPSSASGWSKDRSGSSSTSWPSSPRSSALPHRWALAPSRSAAA